MKCDYPACGNEREEGELYCIRHNRKYTAFPASGATNGLRAALEWCLSHTTGHAIDCNLNQQSRWDEAQQALLECEALPEAAQERQNIAHAQAEINVKRNRCTCGYWEGLQRAEAALAAASGAAGQARPDLSNLTSGEAIARFNVEGLQSEDPVGCGCDEFPECVHSLYWYMGYKAKAAETPAMPAEHAITAEELAQVIREVDGNHELGAAQLAENIIARLTPAAPAFGWFHPGAPGDAFTGPSAAPASEQKEE